MTQETEQRLGFTKNNRVMIPDSIDYTTPGGAFDFLFRQAALDGTWTPPPVMRKA